MKNTVYLLIHVPKFDKIFIFFWVFCYTIFNFKNKIKWSNLCLILMRNELYTECVCIWCIYVHVYIHKVLWRNEKEETYFDISNLHHILFAKISHIFYYDWIFAKIWHLSFHILKMLGMAYTIVILVLRNSRPA